MCCVCAGMCNHVGNHGFCDAHKVMQPPAYVYSTDTQYRDLYSREVARKVELEIEVSNLRQQLAAREDEIALLMVIANDIREVAHNMVQDAKR